MVAQLLSDRRGQDYHDAYDFVIQFSILTWYGIVFDFLQGVHTGHGCAFAPAQS